MFNIALLPVVFLSSSHFSQYKWEQTNQICSSFQLRWGFFTCWIISCFRTYFSCWFLVGPDINLSPVTKITSSCTKFNQDFRAWFFPGSNQCQDNNHLYMNCFQFFWPSYPCSSTRISASLCADRNQKALSKFSIDIILLNYIFEDRQWNN